MRKILLILVMVALAVLVWLFHHPNPDFDGFYNAALHVQHGQALQLYDWRSYGNGAAFVRPAWEVLPYIPLGFLPFPDAFFIWSLVNLFALAICFHRKRKLIAKTILSPDHPFCAAALILLILPVMESLLCGQDTALFLLVLIMMLDAIDAGNHWSAGIWLALASMDAHLALPIFIFAAIRKQWRLLESAVMAGAVLFLVSVAIAGPAWHLHALLAQAATDRIGFVTARYILFRIGLSEAVIAVVLISAILLSFLFVRKLPMSTAISYLVTSAVIFNLHSFLYNYAVTFPAVLRPSSEHGDQPWLT